MGCHFDLCSSFTRTHAAGTHLLEEVFKLQGAEAETFHLDKSAGCFVHMENCKQHSTTVVPGGPRKGSYPRWQWPMVYHHSVPAAPLSNFSEKWEAELAVECPAGRSGSYQEAGLWHGPWHQQEWLWMKHQQQVSQGRISCSNWRDSLMSVHETGCCRGWFIIVPQRKA